MVTQVQEERPVGEQTYTEVRDYQMKLVMPPTLSPNFLYWLTNRLLDVMMKRLKKRKDYHGMEILDNLTMLYLLREKYSKEQVSGMVDEQLIDIVGQVTYLVDFDDDVTEEGA